MTLSRWLDTVTAPFPPDTARRIRRELEEHALAHADALREAGHPDPEGAALTALGSVGQVQHALMQTHFTRAEEEALWANRAYRRAEPRRLGRIVLETLFGLALPFLATLLPGWDNGFAWWGYSVYVTVCLLLAGAEWTIPRRWSSRSARLVLGLFRAGSGLAVMLALYAIWYAGTPHLWFAWNSVALGWGFVATVLLRPLWPHLPKALRGAR